MKLYGLKLSPFVMRPVLAARAKGHELDVVPIPFEGGSKSPEYLALSPMGKIPLFEDGDFTLPESQVITDYLDRVLEGPKLAPDAPKAAARTRLIVRLADLYLMPQIGALFGIREHPETRDAALAGTADALGYIEHFRDAGDSFAVGEAFSVADATLIPMVFFLDALDGMLGTAKLVANRPGLAAWWARAKASELGSRCIAEQAEGMKTMMASRA